MACCNGTKAGDLKHKILIERSGEAPDGSGGFITTWATHKTLRAKIKPLSGKERIYASRIESNTTHLITIRYTTDITEKDRISFKGRLFNMTALLDMDEANKFIEISATENVAT